MIRALLTASALCFVLSACSDPAPVPDSKPPAPIANPASKPATGTPPATATPAAQVVSPTLSRIFSGDESCKKAGFTEKQCSEAWAVANAMAQATPVAYAAQEDCQKHFKRCALRPGKGPGGGGGYAPVMDGFSVGNEKPGVERKPSASAPQWYAPVYRDVKDRWVQLEDQNKKLIAVPITK